MTEPELAPQVEQESVIRIGTNTDLNALALVMERAYAQRDNLALPTTAKQVSSEEIELDLNTPGAWIYTAELGSRVAGFAIGFPYSETPGAVTDTRTEYLSLLMVEPAFWGRGIGSRLLDLVELQARQAGRQHVLLWTRQANNSRTQSIYARRHYKRTGKTANDGPYGPQYQYRLDLYR